MDAPPRRSAWPLVVAVLGVAAIVSLSALYVFRSARALPGEVAERGREALREVRRIAEAFRLGTVTMSFRSYATQVAGSTRLQFATVKQVEVFERTDSAALMWGQLELPDVVVEARAPVEYTYYVDLEKPWTLRLEGDEVLVTAPPIEFNAPSIDASALRYQVRAGSVLRDERAALERLRSGMTEMTRMRARQNVALVRETGRAKVAQFVENWLLQSFDDAKGKRVRVTFADEAITPPKTKGPEGLH
jgi:hypothetical protein